MFVVLQRPFKLLYKDITMQKCKIKNEIKNNNQLQYKHKKKKKWKH